MEGTKKSRSADYTEGEIEAIVVNVKKHWHIINGGFSPTLTKEHKSRAWDQIALACNAAGRVPRSREQVMEKWKKLKSAARAAKAAQRTDRTDTGGGPVTAKPLTDWEELIISFLRQETYQGILGGRDLHAEATALYEQKQSKSANSAKLSQTSQPPITSLPSTSSAASEPLHFEMDIDNLESAIFITVPASTEPFPTTSSMIACTTPTEPVPIGADISTSTTPNNQTALTPPIATSTTHKRTSYRQTSIHTPTPRSPHSPVRRQYYYKLQLPEREDPSLLVQPNFVNKISLPSEDKGNRNVKYLMQQVGDVWGFTKFQVDADTTIS